MLRGMFVKVAPPPSPGCCAHHLSRRGRGDVRAAPSSPLPWRERSPPGRAAGEGRATALSKIAFLQLAVLLLGVGAAHAEPARDVSTLYAEQCASCHGPDRLGAIGPALLPENLGRISPKATADVIANGRPATQMPGFSDQLSAEELQALVRFVQTPVDPPPRWGLDEMKASQIVAVDPATLPEKPVFTADPLNLFVVVEAGDHHVTILDGDRFEPIHRFQSRFALHGGPKFTPDGRFVYFASRDGWVTKFDIYSLQVVAEIRVGINARNIAISGDGKVVAVANYLPHTLVLLDARDLSPMKVLDVKDKRGLESSRVSAVYQAASRKSFIAALKDVPEIWEVFYDENPPKVYSGFVHNYEKGVEEGLAEKGRFPVRRITVEEPLDDFFFDPPYRNLIGSSRDGGKGVVVNLDVGRSIATVDLPGLPHLGSGISWIREGHPMMATPHLKEAAVSVIDLKTWTPIKRIETPGPGFFMRGHENSPYAWTDMSLSPRKDTLLIIDTRSLEITRTITPSPGKAASHVEFTRDGRYALVSVWEMDGALVVYDAATFEEVKRIPMRKPSGKYNVFNKITLSSGTSH
jgi:mono/diheme cytochrome c family protein/DNA-binding beta-propeller fold protein YncE